LFHGSFDVRGWPSVTAASLRSRHNIPMIQIGAYNQLRIARRTDFGVYVGDGKDDVLLPRKYVPNSAEIGDELTVFVTTDSEDRPVATTQRPKAVVGEFAVLRVKAATPIGAFMDWGLDKDLLVPFAEQQRPLQDGDRAVVRVLLDEKTQRVFATTRISRYLKGDASQLREGQTVEILVSEFSPEGVRVAVDRQYLGMIFPDEVYGTLNVGDTWQGFVKRIREDGGIAISLSPQGYRGALEAGPRIMERLKKAGGFLPFSDRSTPEEIRAEFGLSKGTYKKAIGALYRTGTIQIEHHGIRISRDSKIVS